MVWECLLHRGGRVTAGTYYDGETVASLDTVLITLCFGVLAAPQLSVRSKVQVVVHNLTPLHEQQRPALVQNILLPQVACNLVGYFTGLQTEREREGEMRACILRVQVSATKAYRFTATP